MNQKLKCPSEIHYPGIGHPTTGFHLVGVKAPELKLLFKERTTYITWVVELSCAVVVKDLSKDNGMPVRMIISYRIFITTVLEPKVPKNIKFPNNYVENQ